MSTCLKNNDQGPVEVMEVSVKSFIIIRLTSIYIHFDSFSIDDLWHIGFNLI